MAFRTFASSSGVTRRRSVSSPTSTVVSRTHELGADAGQLQAAPFAAKKTTPAPTALASGKGNEDGKEEEAHVYGSGKGGVKDFANRCGKHTANRIGVSRAPVRSTLRARAATTVLRFAAADRGDLAHRAGRARPFWRRRAACHRSRRRSPGCACAGSRSLHPFKGIALVLAAGLVVAGEDVVGRACRSPQPSASLRRSSRNAPAPSSATSLPRWAPCCGLGRWRRRRRRYRPQKFQR